MTPRTFLPLFFSATVCLVFARQAGAQRNEGIPQTQRYAALLAKARAGTLRINHGEPPVDTNLFRTRGPAVANSEIFPPTSYRAGSKTSFAAAGVETFTNLRSLFRPLPADAAMSRDFPALARRRNNTSPRVDLEKRNVKVAAWIYWVGRESDHDFHVLLGSTSRLTDTTILMNSEVSGLPSTNPARSPFPQRRADIRRILADHENANGLFVHPVPVTVTGSLLWDGEHQSPNTVGPEGLQPAKAWEIHPIKQLADR